MNANITQWLKIGQRNHWIRQAWDPPFTPESFHRCETREELRERISHGNWCLGQAFYLGNLCFIQQVVAGDEWLAIRGDLDFDSVSLGRLIELGEFEAWIDAAQQATDEQLRVAHLHGVPTGVGFRCRCPAADRRRDLRKPQRRRPMNRDQRKRARRWMRLHVAEYVDGCGEVNSTCLAEDCSNDLGHPEWCDEPGDTGAIWELAFEAACRFEEGGTA